MDDVYKASKTTLFLFCFLLSTLLVPAKAHAFGIDLLGDLSEPLIGPAKEKMKSILVYIWMQPYAGYASGSSEQKRTAPGGATTTAGDLDVQGFYYGGRGGLLIMSSLRVGLDYTIQSISRDTLVEGPTNTYSRQSVKSKNSMLGAVIGIDVPYTPLQAYYTKYFKAHMNGDAASNGDGWGTGVSFVLKNPFILSLEMRSLTYSASESSGKRADGSFKQYYAGLSFMLF